MVAAIRQSVTVGQDGRIEIRSPQLLPGTKAEVIVMVESAQAISPQAALDELQRSMRLNQETAQAWIDQVRDERQSTTRLPVTKAG